MLSGKTTGARGGKNFSPAVVYRQGSRDGRSAGGSGDQQMILDRGVKANPRKGNLNPVPRSGSRGQQAGCGRPLSQRHVPTEEARRRRPRGQLWRMVQEHSWRGAESWRRHLAIPNPGLRQWNAGVNAAFLVDSGPPASLGKDASRRQPPPETGGGLKAPGDFRRAGSARNGKFPSGHRTHPGLQPPATWGWMPQEGRVEGSYQNSTGQKATRQKSSAGQGRVGS